MTKPAPANPMYVHQPLRDHGKTFSCDPLLREELEASYRSMGVEILPSAMNPHPQQGQARKRR